ncbi:MAG: trigger factor [Anaerolineae bacterium]
MNIQTEHLENRTARFTVEVDTDRFEQAKRKAARHIARQINIPGFRKGKAPYNILVQNGLEPQIVMDAVEELSQEIYRETLEQSDIDPYGPGSFDDYQMEPAITFIYTVPLQPVVDLKDYRAIRLAFEEPAVSDESVDEAMKRLQQQEALVEESQQPAAVGNRVIVDIHSEFVDDPALSEEEATTEQPAKGASFVHEHDGQIFLDPADEPILKGFKDAVVGAKVGDSLEFELEVPGDDEEYADIAGRKVHFHVDVKKIEVVTLPSLNDDFAARLTEEGEEPMTLLQLRMKMREELQKQVTQQANENYASQVLGEIVKQADVSYPDAMLDDQVESMIRDLDRRLQQQGMNLDTFIRLTGSSMDGLKAQYREPAIDTLTRSLVLGQIVKEENIKVPQERINARIDEMLQRFGDQAEQLRSMFDSPNMRSAIEDDLLQELVLARVVGIGRGEPMPEPETANQETAADVVAQTDTDAVAEVEASDESDLVDNQDEA